MQKKHFILLIFLLVLPVWLFAALPSEDTLVNFAGMKFKRIPAGSFEMGFEGDSLSLKLPYGLYDEHPRHTVTLTRPFYMGMYEVTIGQYKKGDQNWINRWKDVSWPPPLGNNYPIHTVSWFEADSFCRWLTQNDSNGWTYRLPTEAEWEYCYRGGTSTPYYTGNSITTSAGNLCLEWGCSVTLKVPGGYPPNPFGLYDMAGNALEWCQDWYGHYTTRSDTNPMGYTTGNFRVNRDARSNRLGARASVRGGSQPEYYSHLLGFRVVISDTDSLQWKAEPDTLSRYQKSVQQSRPLPSTAVKGEIYLDLDSREFKRVRMTRAYYPRQCDTMLYVSINSIHEISVVDRKSAGLFAQTLSTRFGVLYRISNRYELFNAGISAVKGEHYLTIIPDLAYSAGQPHPDVSYFSYRDAPLIAKTNHGPVYWDWNIGAYLTEAGNGDLLMGAVTDISENEFNANMGVRRLRLGETSWDSMDVLEDVPGFENSCYLSYDYRRGQLVAHSVVIPNDTRSIPFYKTSDDNGVTWSRPTQIQVPNGLCRHWNSDGLLEMGYDTLVRVDAATGNLFISYDGGYNNWKLVSNSMTGIEHAFCLLDNGSFLFFNRGTGNFTDVSAKWTLSNLTAAGVTVKKERSPFIKCCEPGSHNGHVGIVKLFSGRVLRRTIGPSEYTSRIIGESVDQGQTWFSRARLVGGVGDMIQTRDGLIHIATEMNRIQSSQREYIISEQWFREQGCKDINTWGFNEPGMVSNCENTEPEYFDSTSSVAVESAYLASPTRRLALDVWPNPFRPDVQLAFSKFEKGMSLRIYDCTGRLTRNFTSSELMEKTRVEWNAKGFGAGLYFAVLEGQGQQCIVRLVLAK